jgi:hypothetical protein
MRTMMDMGMAMAGMGGMTGAGGMAGMQKNPDGPHDAERSFYRDKSQ